MFNVTTKSMQWGDETLTLETGKVARQADGSVIATLGETSVMANVTFAKEAKPGQDFFPLTVHYQEKYYAAGKVPGGFFKREARPTEKETLTARLIDRPIRPLFVSGFKNEVLVMCTVLSHDLVNDPDIVAMIAASAALTISGAPFRGPIAGCRVGFVDGEYVLNPDIDDMHDLKSKPEQRLDLVVAGTKDAVMMVESEAYELTEAEMLGAVTFAHEQIQPVIDLIIDLAEEAANEPFDFQAPDISELYEAVKAAGEDKLREAYKILDKQDRVTAQNAARDHILESLTEEQREDINVVQAIKKLEASILRGDVVKSGKRIDGRDLDTVRPIVAETRRSAPDPWLGAVHARGNPGPGHYHPGYRRRRTDDRRAARHLPVELPFALQLPALFGRRSGPRGLSGPARDWPRQACLARAAGGSASGNRLPLHGPRGVGDHGIQRLVVHGFGLRRIA